MTPSPPNDAPGTDTSVDEQERIPVAEPRHTFLWVLLSGWLLSAEAWLRSHGGRGLRWSLRAFWGAIAIAGVILLVGPVINKPITLDDITGSASTAADQWIAREFATDYRISRTPEGMLEAQVEERSSALFPDDVSETGIERVLATQYQGHSLQPRDIEATLDGEPIEVERSATSDRLTLTMDTGEVLTGDHVFVVKYTLNHLAYSATDTATDQDVDLLEWDVFGPSWPTAFAKLDVRVILPAELDSELIREPRGSLAWTIAGAGEWLSPDEVAPNGDVTYRFTNEQNIPPNAQAWFTLSFEPGTFSQPAPSTLFWVQSYGPLAPLAFLAITLLLALAARAVAWSDARGRPWFVAQFDPPKGISTRMAAVMMRTPRVLELAEALDVARSGIRRKPSRADKASAKGRLAKRKPRTPVNTVRREALLAAAAKVAHRAGRLGDLPRAFARYSSASEHRAVLTEGLRRVPHGFVRDLFIAAPIALTIVQWGLVRQLSFQSVVSAVWWPTAFVLVSTVIAAIVLWIALSAVPLTEEGALIKQHLMGIDVYATRTQLLDRAVSREPVLPYAVLMAEPRTAGTKVAAMIDAELGENSASSQWRTPDFVTRSQFLVRALSVLIVGVAIAAVVVLPNPYDRAGTYTAYSWDIPGTLYTKVQSFDADAELSRTNDGHARIEATETMQVSFVDEGSRIPQFARQWPASVNGQDLQFEVLSVQIDGADVPYAASPAEKGTVLMQTQLVGVTEGVRTVEVTYAIESAAIAAQEGLTVVDRVRWAAVLDGWKYNSQWDGDPPLESLNIELRVADELAAVSVASGWIAQDTDSAESARDWKDSVVPFDSELFTNNGGSSETAGGVTTYSFDLTADENGTYPWDLTMDDLGPSFDFPAGTFEGPDPAQLRWTQFMVALPMGMILLFAGLGVLLGGAGIYNGWERRGRAFTPGPFRDLIRVFAPAAALAATIMFFWASADMPADHSALPPMGWSSLAAIAAAVTGIVLTRHSRRP
ncbi:MAG TPA: DUF2207 domain-containing protein [Glaciihabitans sp.]|nr:DUF2207 domain-containing protein [Glaciihabitans sp.]